MKQKTKLVSFFVIVILLKYAKHTSMRRIGSIPLRSPLLSHSCNSSEFILSIIELLLP